MKTLKLAVLYLCCAPWDVALIVLSFALLRPWGVAGSRVHRGVLWLDVREGSLLQRKWAWSTTLGHVVLLQPGLSGSEVEAHELVHVRQYEGAVLSVWLMAAALALASRVVEAEHGALLALLVAPWAGYAGASLAAALRSQRPYLDNHFERHARADAPAFREPLRGAAQNG